MIVTKKNFEAVLPEVLDAISSADFVAIDTEFTGLSRRADLKASPVDSLESRYCRMRDSARQFTVLQYGLCVFTSAGPTDEYVCKPYSFSVFPASHGTVDPTFLCQSGSIKFLARSGFDFSASFKTGIPFLSVEQEQALSRDIIARYEAALAKATKALTRTDVATLSPEDAAWRDALAVQIQTFREDMVKGGVDEKKEGEKGEKEEAEVKGEEASVAFPAEPPAVLSVGDKEEGELPVEVKAATAASLDPLSFPHFVTDAMNGSRRRLLFELVEEFPDLDVFVNSVDQLKGDSHSGKRCRVSFVGSEAVRSAIHVQRSSERRDHDLAAVAKAIGFRKVIDHISASGTPVVGHNCYFDLLHTTDKFVGALPPAPNAWKSQLQSLLPVIFDTKYLLTSKMKDIVKVSELQPALRALERRAAAAQSAATPTEEAAPEDVNAAGAPSGLVVSPSLTFPLAPGFQWKQTAAPDAAVAVPAEGEVDDAPAVDAVVAESAATGSAHDSGFDAFMTGSLFVRCLQHLGYSREELLEVTGHFRRVRAPIATSPDTPFVYALSDRAVKLKKLTNVIAISRCTPSEWNLAPDAPAPRRPPSKAYMVWIYNTSTALSEDDVLTDLAVATGVPESAIRRGVTWVDHHSLFVQFSSAAEAAKAVACLQEGFPGMSPAWGPTVKVGYYRDFLLANQDVFGDYCAADLVEPAPKRAPPSQQPEAPAVVDNMSCEPPLKTVE